MEQHLARLVRYTYTRLESQAGQTMAEYGLLIAIIALVVLIAAVALGGNISAVLNSTVGQL
ncbi:MAG: Flp family type IVb pilin [Actinomycetota bacterium]|nr:Flp family type IVb pilin [Actinomycetota bacterium]